jgi:5'-methylthioadenosine phosphorylase
VRVGIVTGSGSYELAGLARAAPEPVATRFGTTEITRGRLGGVEVVHLARHGRGHRLLSSQVAHRANVVALQQAGVDAILAVTVCGSLDPALAPGELVVFDDLHFLANRLPDGAICTLHDEPGAPGRGHWIFDGPFAPALRAALLAGVRATGRDARDGGCYGHVDGPRFNTRAELRSLRLAGVSAVSQTAGPETVLAGEAGVPYALLGFVTDYANGVSPDAPTPVQELTRLLRASRDVLAEVLAAAVARIDPGELAPVGTRVSWD